MTSFQSCVPDQCGYLQTCTNLTLTNGTYGSYCQHDNLFPMNAYTAFIDSLIPIFIGMGMCGGNGGGILKGPFLEILLNYSLSEATAIAYCFMFGGCIINAIILLFDKNPFNPKKPLIHFNAGMILNLGIPLASNIGSSLAAYLNELTIITIQQVYLLVLFPVVLYKAIKVRKEEKMLNTNENKNESDLFLPNAKLNYQSRDISSQNEQQYFLFQQKSQQRFPIYQLFMIFLTFAICQVFVQLRSLRQKKNKDILVPCILMDHLLFPLLLICDIFLWVLVYIEGRRDELKMDQCQFEPDDRFFTPITKFIALFTAGFIASFMSGLIGFGAVIFYLQKLTQGLIMLPTLIFLGLPTRIAAATSGYIYLWLSMNNLITLLTEKLLPLEETLWFTLLALLGGSVVTKIGYYLITKYKIAYIVVFIVVGLDALNFLSGFLFIYLQIHRFGEDSLLQPGDGC